ncbi:MAG: hypothetical protein M4579_002052 [Chaenotheca gracillima]|nr:MAG: hypothetical protein M4579_002052 [Chaenotheca gracillima]
MPAMLNDPASATIYRMSGEPPFPTPYDPQLPSLICPRQVTLRDRVTIATLIPFSSPRELPQSLLAYLCDQLNREIELGDTYPMMDPMPLPAFGPYWFANFGAVMVLGKIDRAEDLHEDMNWSKECLGSFYIKPNYPGRSSHVCNGGFLVTDAARNRGVGRLMGEGYLEWAPTLGYTYSVFNLVYETNVASCRIWDALGFKRIGRVKGCGNLRSYPGQYIDAIIYGRDLGPEGEDFVSEERFDKIKFYLKHGKYPTGADRAEKSRLRSAATHYKLLEGDKLMLKDKEVISDPQRQYEIARAVHVLQHGGINKTTATIAEKYHWVRIKETVSLVIRNCTECKEMAKAPVVRNDGVSPNSGMIREDSVNSDDPTSIGDADHILDLSVSSPPRMDADADSMQLEPPEEEDLSAPSSQIQLPDGMHTGSQPQHHHQHQHHNHHQHHPHHHPSSAPIANMQQHQPVPDYSDIPLDPQIMEEMRSQLYDDASITPNDTDHLFSNPGGSHATHHISSNLHHHNPHTHHYQTLLSNDDAPSDDVDDALAGDPDQHHHHVHGNLSQPGHHHHPHHDLMFTDEETEMLVAAKANAAAQNAAQDAMIDDSPDGESIKRQLQRQFLGVGTTFGGPGDDVNG